MTDRAAQPYKTNLYWVVRNARSLIRLMVSVDLKHHEVASVRAQELCESRGGRPGLSVPNSPYGLCGRKAN